MPRELENYQRRGRASASPEERRAQAFTERGGPLREPPKQNAHEMIGLDLTRARKRERITGSASARAEVIELENALATMSTPAPIGADARFAAEVEKYMKANGVDYRTAFNAVRHAQPDLYDAFRRDQVGGGNETAPRTPAELLNVVHEAESTFYGRPVDEDVLAAEVRELCTRESVALFDEAQKIRKEQWTNFGRQISTSAAMRRLKAERPELFRASLEADRTATETDLRGLRQD
jgi:hypothetical protein